MKKMMIGVLLLALSGCAGLKERTQQVTWLEVLGTVGGAAIGGVVGSQFGAGFGGSLYTAGGALVGGTLGYATARRLAPTDQALYDSTANKALAEARPGEVLSWTNAETGNSGIFRTVESYQAADGRLCRSYRTTVAFPDAVEAGGGTACRQTDGSWQQLSDELG